METAQEFFVHELSDMLDAEQRILAALQQQEKETDRGDLKKAFTQHKGQTQKQIERLQQCLESIDEEEEEAECRGIMGLIEEKQAFMQEEPSEELLDLFNIGAASKVEHYEIAAYTALIDTAKKLGHKKAVRFLQQNLNEEQQMLKKCEGFMKKFKPSRTGVDEEESEDMRVHQRRAA